MLNTICFSEFRARHQIERPILHKSLFDTKYRAKYQVSSSKSQKTCRNVNQANVRGRNAPQSRDKKSGPQIRDQVSKLSLRVKFQGNQRGFGILFSDFV